MTLFSFTYWDRHKDRVIDEEGNIIDKPRDKNWYKFKYIFDVNEVRITDFNSTVIFEDDDTPIECTEVTMSNDKIFYAVNKIDTFEKNYRENCLPLFTETKSP